MDNPLLNVAAFVARIMPAPLKRALYRFAPLARLIRGGLNRAAPRGLTRISVAAGGLSGATLLLDLQEEKDYWLGTYEPELQSAVMEMVEPEMVAYDVGANIGYISILLARRAGEKGRVLAFEALPANLERLRQNLALNDMGAQVRVVEAAVMDHSGPAQFLVGPSGGMGKAAGSAGRQTEDKQAISVTGLALDDFVHAQGNPAPQVVKMDIEGGELLALPGMRRLLRETHPLILLELHGPEAARMAWDELSRAGYHICRMEAGYPTVDSVEALDWKAYIVAK
jgi:FkbM family methyltransferase